HIGHPEAADDPRFSTVEALMTNWADASGMMVTAFAKKPFEYWRQHMKTYTGQWAPIQSLLDLSTDEQALANDMIIEVDSADGGDPIRLGRGPGQLKQQAVETTRAPQAAEHTETVLMELGLEWSEIEELKAAG